jgi:hypothetical protein
VDLRAAPMFPFLVAAHYGLEASTLRDLTP